MIYWFYILYSASMGKYYVGSTHDLDGRLRRHLSNHRGYTANAKDWQLVYSKRYFSKIEALKRERHIKHWKSKTRIQDLITKGSEHPELLGRVTGSNPVTPTAKSSVL